MDAINAIIDKLLLKLAGRISLIAGRSHSAYVSLAGMRFPASRLINISASISAAPCALIMSIL